MKSRQCSIIRKLLILISEDGGLSAFGLLAEWHNPQWRWWHEVPDEIQEIWNQLPLSARLIAFHAAYRQCCRDGDD
jgi:hypothetical protein